METLPKGLLKKVIDEGYPPREAMKEAWRRVKTQQKRYATRMSYGGGYPLGYKGRNPLPIGFGARLKELIAEGLPAKEAMKEAWREVKKSRTKTGTYSGSREIFGRKRRKNPKRSKHYKTSKGIFYFPTFQAARKHAQDNGHPTNRIIEYQKGWAIQLRVSGPYVGLENGSMAISDKEAIQREIQIQDLLSETRRSKNPGSQTLAAWATKWNVNVHHHKSGSMFVIASLLDRKAEVELYRLKDYVVSSNVAGTIWLVHRRNPKSKKQTKVKIPWVDKKGKHCFRLVTQAQYKRFVERETRDSPFKRKNPIAIYNPPKQKLLYGHAYIPVIRGIKTNGRYKGERYEHKFSKNEVSIYGNSDGSLMVKSNNNLRLWNYDKNI